MLSYTSSSNTRIPDAPYGKLWLVTVSVFVITLAFFEWFWRQQGHLPSVADNMRFWAMHRADVYEKDGKKRIVIVGASRAQWGLLPSVMQRAFPQFRIKHLAINGISTYGVVQDLCEDASFNGIILWDTLEGWMFPKRADETRDDFVYADFFHDDFGSVASMDRNLNCLIGARLQNHLVTLSPNLQFRMLLRARLQPKRDFLRMHFDRYRAARLHGALSPAGRAGARRAYTDKERRISRGFDTKSLIGFIKNDLRSLHQRQQLKGGDLILLRMPTEGELWAVADSAAPKEHFWDRIHELSGVTTIHFRDYPELSSFDCPDGSHLDATDAPEFTRRLSLILRKKLEEDGDLPPSKPMSASAEPAVPAANR